MLFKHSPVILPATFSAPLLHLIHVQDFLNGLASLPLMKLNLGCGKDMRPGYVNLDLLQRDGVDLIHDLNKTPYPFEDNQFDEIIANNILEHVYDVVKTLEEIYRISKPGAIIKATVPYGSNWVAHIDHKRGFNYTTFKSLSENNFGTYYYPHLKLRQTKLVSIPTGIGRLIPNIYIPFCQLKLREIVSTFINNIVKNLYVELRVEK